MKSCSSTRAGAKEISFWTLPRTSQRASASMSAAFTNRPSSCRKQVLEQDLQRERQAGDFGKPGGLERRQAVDLEAAAADVADPVRVPKLFTLDMRAGPLRGVLKPQSSPTRL